MSDDRGGAGNDNGRTLDYDALSGSEQARVRAEWDERMSTLLDGLDYERDFERDGHAYVELDDRDRVVHRGGADRV